MDNKMDFSWKRFLSKVFLVFAGVLAVVVISDSTELFEGDQVNNHTERKWRSFYRFTEKKHCNPDILIFGNSHASASFDPYTISAATGSYCQILNSSGTRCVDSYYGLKEALKYCKPSIVMLETYSMTGDGNGQEWGLIQSINAKKGFFNRLKLAISLLPPDAWIKCMSSTVRNHSFLLTDPKRIKFNLDNMGKEKNPDRREYDFGRFSHGSSSLSEATLKRYETEGPVVHADKFEFSKKIRKNVKKMYSLCQKNGIKLVFVTAPIYYKSFDDYDAVKSKYQQLFDTMPEAQWLDIQSLHDKRMYGTAAFMDEYDASQHNSSYGMLLNTDIVCTYLVKKFGSILPDRTAEKPWAQALWDSDLAPYYGKWTDLGFKNRTLLFAEGKLGQMPVTSIFQDNEAKRNSLVVKLPKLPYSYPEKLAISAYLKDGSGPYLFSLVKSQYYNPYKHVIFTSSLPPEVEVGKPVMIGSL